MDTLWAFGTLNNYASLTYQTMDSLRNGDLGSLLIGQPMVLQLVKEQIYISIEFSAWGEHGAGGFAYTRSTPAAALPTPAVTITNPVAGAVFAAPANVKLGATASVSSGTVTNVAFFGNGSLLGSVQTTPFNVTSSALAAGSYSLTAVATAAGISATSTPVSISVAAPVTVTNSAPQVSNGIFAFSYSANIGLTYVVQDSSDLVNWLSMSTNVAATSSIQATDTFSAGSPRFYRIIRRPNP